MSGKRPTNQHMPHLCEALQAVGDDNNDADDGMTAEMSALRLKNINVVLVVVSAPLSAHA